MNNEENKFWAVVWKLVGAVICTFMLSVASCTMYDSYVTLEAAKNGIDPLRFKCAMSSGSSQLHYCTLLATKDIEQRTP